MVGLILMLLTDCLFGQIPWRYKITGTNHTIFLPDESGIDVSGFSGTGILGVFYDSLGVEVCAGYVDLNGVQEYLVAYGESNTNDGVSSGEQFKFKLWDKERNCTFENVNVTYSTTTDMPNQGTFVADGMSKIQTLEARAYNITYPTELICPGDSAVIPMSMNNTEINRLNFSADEGLDINAQTGIINGSRSLPGTYTVTIKSDVCIAQPQQSIRVSPYRDVTISEKQLKCPEQQLDLNNLAREAVDSWRLLDSSPQVALLDTGSHYISFISQDGCVVSKKMYIMNYPKPVLEFEQQYQCKSTTIRLLNDDQVSMSLWPDNELEIYENMHVQFSYTDTNNCPREETIEVEVKKLKADVLDYIVQQADCYNRGRIEITNATVENAIGNVEYFFVNQLTNDTVRNPDEVSEGRYQIQVADERNCRDAFPQEIMVMKDCLSDRPVFSPNNDYVDDKYFISETGTAEVYNRNGTKVSKFQTPVYWDGTNQQGQKLPMGTYLIVINGKKTINITILR